MTEPFFDETAYTETDRTLTTWPRITRPYSTTIPIFISHTSKDGVSIRKWLLPIVEWVVFKPFMLNYDSFKDPRFREAYANQILQSLRGSEHLLIVMSQSTLASDWVREEVNWWLTRRGNSDITIASLDGTKGTDMNAGLQGIRCFSLSQNHWITRILFSLHLRRALASSGWLIVKRWPRRIHRSMLPKKPKTEAIEG